MVKIIDFRYLARKQLANYRGFKIRHSIHKTGEQWESFKIDFDDIEKRPEDPQKASNLIFSQSKFTISPLPDFTYLFDKNEDDEEENKPQSCNKPPPKRLDNRKKDQRHLRKFKNPCSRSSSASSRAHDGSQEEEGVFKNNQCNKPKGKKNPHERHKKFKKSPNNKESKAAKQHFVGLWKNSLGNSITRLGPEECNIPAKCVPNKQAIQYQRKESMIEGDTSQDINRNVDGKQLIYAMENVLIASSSTLPQYRGIFKIERLS